MKVIVLAVIYLSLYKFIRQTWRKAYFAQKLIVTPHNYKLVQVKGID